MMMPQQRLFDDCSVNTTGSFDLADTRRRPQMIGDTVGAAEAGGGDDFFVVNAFSAITRFVRMSDVPLTGDGTHFEIGWHINSSRFTTKAQRTQRKSRYSAEQLPSAYSFLPYRFLR